MTTLTLPSEEWLLAAREPISGWAPVVLEESSDKLHIVTSALTSRCPVMIEFVPGSTEPELFAVMKVYGGGHGTYRIIDPRRHEMISDEVHVPFGFNVIEESPDDPAITVTLTRLRHVVPRGKEFILIIDPVGTPTALAS